MSDHDNEKVSNPTEDKEPERSQEHASENSREQDHSSDYVTNDLQENIVYKKQKLPNIYSL